jgi:hypothetical protein
MMTLFRSLAMSTVLAFAVIPASFAADATDPAIGTWKLNVEKSTIAADRVPKSMTRTYAAAAGGTSMTVTGVAADGSPISQSALLTYDGKDVPFTGSPMWDTLSLKKVNGSTVKSELKKGGKVVGHTTRTISGQGKVLTLTNTYKSAKGGTIHETDVYDKQ